MERPLSFHSTNFMLHHHEIFAFQLLFVRRTGIGILTFLSLAELLPTFTTSLHATSVRTVFILTVFMTL